MSRLYLLFFAHTSERTV